MKMQKTILTLSVAAVGIAAAPKADAVLARYVQVVKAESPDTRFHLSELEVFTGLAVPDDLGGATFGGFSTSTNDHLDASMVAYGLGNAYPLVGTTTALEHGLANRDPNNVLENVGNVWSTGNAQPAFSQYTLDLGSMVDVTTVRLWSRADACCGTRWQNLEVNLLDDTFAIADQVTGLGGGTNSGLEVNFTAVPEPSGVALLGLAASALFFRRRR
ncbi:MAG: hypothetical protein ACI9NC_000989 [Verrucomicrobiales bacterium]|jgi:hypothetical protein